MRALAAAPGFAAVQDAARDGAQNGGQNGGPGDPAPGVDTAGGVDVSPLGDAAGAIGETLRRLLYLPEQASTVAPEIDRLQYVEFVGFWVIGILLFAATFYFVVRYRRRSEEEDWAPTPRVRAPLWLELGVAGLLLVFFVAVWWIGFRQYVDVGRAPDDALEVFVTARQWVWKFEYAEGPTSAGVLYVPAGRPVRLIVTSRDVIHSFFVPDFRLKRDAVPGQYTSLWFEAPQPGRHQVLCAEFCGPGHSRMWGEVVVLEPEDFAAWLEGDTPAVPLPGAEGAVAEPGEGRAPETRLAERGREVAVDEGCVQCHSVDGEPHIGPTFLGLWGRRVALASGDTVTATPAYLTESMMDPEAEIVAGFEPVMPSYEGVLEPGQVGALLAYLRSLGTAGATERHPEEGEPGAGDPAGEATHEGDGP